MKSEHFIFSGSNWYPVIKGGEAPHMLEPTKLEVSQILRLSQAQLRILSGTGEIPKNAGCTYSQGHFK